jgi:hypothetical protein
VRHDWNLAGKDILVQIIAMVEAPLFANVPLKECNANVTMLPSKCNGSETEIILKEELYGKSHKISPDRVERRSVGDLVCGHGGGSGCVRRRNVVPDKGNGLRQQDRL